MVKTIIKETGASSMSYIGRSQSATRVLHPNLNHNILSGHSQGATSALAAFSRDAELSSRIKIAVAFAPASDLSASDSILIKAFKDLKSEAALVEEMGSHEMFPTSSVSSLMSAGCVLVPYLCKKAITKIAGGSLDNLDAAALAVAVAHTPTGTSARNLAHWMQLANSKELRSFTDSDGKGGKVYDYSKATVPLAVFYGTDDAIVPPDAIKALIGKYGSVEQSNQIEGYGHLDFIFGIDRSQRLHFDVIGLLNSKNGFPVPIGHGFYDKASQRDCAAWAAR